MKEAGIDISKKIQEHLDKFSGQRFDLAVTVCDDAREECPIFPT